MTKKAVGIAFGSAMFFGFAQFVLAAVSNGPSDCGSGGGLVNPLSTCSLLTVVQDITNILLYIAAPAATIMVLYGGFQMMTAAGEPEKFSNGRKTILYAAIGFAVVLLANQVVPIIQSVFK